MSALTAAQAKAIEQLRAGPCHRNKEGWVSPGGQFFALVVMASLRKRGLAKLSEDRREIRISQRGRALQDSAMLREFIDWHEVADQLPESDITVLIYSPHGDEPVWLGWFEDGGSWYEVGGGEITDVLRWAHLPARGIPDARTPS